jgi:hypothetical protein
MKKFIRQHRGVVSLASLIGLFVVSVLLSSDFEDLALALVRTLVFCSPGTCPELSP